MRSYRARLVTAPLDPMRCRATHPLTRGQCANGPYGHDLHWTTIQDGGVQWATDTGKTSSAVGQVYVTYFARFVPLPGFVADEVIEHFPDPVILRHELVRRITYGYGQSFAPGDNGARTLHYRQVDREAYMDVWVIVSADHRVHDPVPDPCDHHPVERWSWAERRYMQEEFREISQRSQYLPLVAR